MSHHPAMNRALSNESATVVTTPENLQRRDAQPLDTDDDEQLFFVTSYSDFNSLGKRILDSRAQEGGDLENPNDR